MPLLASLSFDALAEIRLVFTVAPASVLSAAHRMASSLTTPFVSPIPPVPWSRLQSYQVMARKPVVWSRASLGLNWLFVVVSWFTLMGVLHVAPESSECLSMMSVLLLSLGVSDVQM